MKKNDRQPVQERTLSRVEDHMLIAIEEAEQSLRQGNSGFGAVIVKDGNVIARTHDTDKTDGDPTAPAARKPFS